MVRFIHTSDWQLGMTRHFLGPEAQARFSAARVEAVRSIGRLAVSEGCGFVVVAGDVFDSNHLERQVVVRALEAMAATPEVTFYLLPGNHDPLDAASVFRSRTFLDHVSENVVVLDSNEVVKAGEGVELIAAPWTSKRPLADLVANASQGLPAPDPATQRILVGHGAVELLSPSTSDPALISVSALEAQLADGALGFVALGDRHSTTSIGETGRIWYSGTPEPTDHQENDPANVLVVTLDDAAAEVVPHRVGTWSFLRLAYDLTGVEDVERLTQDLDSIPDKMNSVVRLSLVGQLNLAEHANLGAVLDHHTDLLASLQVWAPSSDLVVLPDDEDFARLPLAGFAREALDDLRAELTDAATADVARDSLGLLYRLVGASS